MDNEVPLAGGIANQGKVVRVGDTVRRPASSNTPAIFALLQHLHEVGFDGAPHPLGIDDRGREILTFIEGDVPIPPFPSWSMSDATLASTVRLMRRFHEAAVDFDVRAHNWCDDLADLRAGIDINHNDICPENVVYRDGDAVALLDWDFAAPGRPVWDVAAMVSMWGPLHGSSDRAAGMEDLDPFARARTIADAYGLEGEDRVGFAGVLVERLSISLVETRAAAGDPAFIQMLAQQGGKGRAQRRRDWLAENLSRLHNALA